MNPKQFKNEPFTPFTLKQNQVGFMAALENVQQNFGQNLPMLIGSKSITRDENFPSFNPSNKNEIIATFPKASSDDTQNAIDCAKVAFVSWSKWPTHKRVEIIQKAAQKLRERKHIFSSFLVFEAGKTWTEADGDTAEAIDFMEYYALEALRYSQEQALTKIPSEENELRYIPLGVGAVIPPWNFPLAICVGMTVAAIVCGNTVVLKPASDTPTVAYHFVQLLLEVGLPHGVVNFITGSGSSIGDQLVLNPDVRFISFTGSKEVGLRINELAAKMNPKQKWIKRVVLEMGGKDAILVDENVRIEQVATDIVSSAFGYSGQKCSACSRALIHHKVYDELVQALIEKTNKLIVANPIHHETNMGPVINLRSKQKILEYIEIGKTEGRMLLGDQPARDDGYYVSPSIFENIEQHHRLFQEEIFGPVLSISKINSFEHGLELANATEFGLTGSIISNNREHLEKARDDFFVGNLYLNRKCTGALVGVHPFGGFNMSGTDSKAGGRDYLLLFTQAKLISEKLA